MARRRAAVLIGVHVLAAIHIAHWLLAGRTLAPLELNEVLHTLHLGVITAGFLFMALAVIATAIFGRFFCSWGCHLLALQDLSAWLLEKLGMRPRPIRSRALLWLPLGAMLYLFVWPQIERIGRGAPPPSLRIASDADGWASFITQDFWRNLPGPAIALITFFVCGFVVVYVLGSRSFCRYACPYGAAFGLADRVAPGRIVATGACDGCGVCTAVCHSHVRVHEEVRASGTILDSRCLKDLDCITVCPKGALHYGLTLPPILRPSVSLAPRHDLSWGEDAVLVGVALAALLILRGLYGAVPFLLALAAAIVVGASVVIALRLHRRPRVRVGHVDLRARSRLTRAGLAFVIVLSTAGVFLAHSAVVRWHEVLGASAFEDVQASIARGRSPARTEVDRAIEHLDAALRAGLFAPTDLRRRLASLYALRDGSRRVVPHLEEVLDDEPDDTEARLRLARALFARGDARTAERELDRVVRGAAGEPRRQARMLRATIRERANDLDGAERDLRASIAEEPDHATSYLALGALLARRGENEEAAMHLARACGLDPRDATARTSLGAVLAELGRLDEAIDVTRAAVSLAPHDAAAHANLGLLLAARHEVHEARAYLRRALELDPRDADARAALALLDPPATEGSP